MCCCIWFCNDLLNVVPFVFMRNISLYFYCDVFGGIRVILGLSNELESGPLSFYFLEVFVTGWYYFAFQQHYMRVQLDPNPCQRLLLSVVFIKTIVLSLSWYLVFLICIFLITNYVDDLFMCLLAIDIIFWWSVYSCLLFTCISTLWQIKKFLCSNIKDDYRHESQHTKMYGFSFFFWLLQCVEGICFLSVEFYKFFI